MALSKETTFIKESDIVIGIDPGLDGAMTAIMDGEIFLSQVAPIIKSGSKRQFDLGAMRHFFEFCSQHCRPHLFIEQVGPMPKQGVTSTFNFGMGYGLWIGLAAGMGIPITKVRPQQWKGGMLAGTKKDKGAAILRAKELWPVNNFKATERCKKDHDGLAESALIAEYGRRTLAGLSK